MAEGNPQEASRLLHEDVVLLRRTAYRVDTAWLCAWLGVAALHLGDLAQARHNLGEALRAAVRSRDFFIGLHALLAAALLKVIEGHGTRAAALWALASRYPHVARSPFFQHLVGQPVTALATHLPPGVAHAAQESGQAGDLWATVEALLAELE